MSLRISHRHFRTSLVYPLRCTPSTRDDHILVRHHDTFIVARYLVFGALEVHDTSIIFQVYWVNCSDVGDGRP